MKKKEQLCKYLDAATSNLNWNTGHRHSTLISLCGCVTQNGFDEDDVVNECVSRYAQSDFDATEIEHTVRDCFRRYPVLAGTTQKKSWSKKDKRTKGQEAIVQEDVEDLVDEDELLSTPVPNVDGVRECIPSYFWHYTIPQNGNEYTRFAALIALIVSAGAIFEHIRCQFRSHEKATGKLFFITSGPAASGKSCIEKPHELFYHYAKCIEDESEAEIIKQQEAYKIWKSCQSKCKEEDCGCGAEPFVPKPIRINLSLNISASKLTHQLAQNKNKPCLVFTSELDANLNYKENPISPVLREGYENETISSYTHAHGDVRVDKPYMSVLAAGTPLQLVKFLENKENGLTSRFLTMYLPESEYRGLADEVPVDYKQACEQKKAFVERAKTFGKYAEKTDLTYDIDKTTRAKIDDCIRCIEKRYSAFASEELTSFTRRLPKMIISMAMILQTFQLYEQQTPTYSIRNLDGEIVEMVLSWVPYFVEQHLRLLNSLPDTPINTDGNAMKYAHIAKKLPCEFTFAEACDIFRKYTEVSSRTVRRVLKKWTKAGRLSATHNHYTRTDCGEPHIAG